MRFHNRCQDMRGTLWISRFQFGWTVVRRTGESNRSGCEQPSNASQACPVPTKKTSAAKAELFTLHTARLKSGSDTIQTYTVMTLNVVVPTFANSKDGAPSVVSVRAARLKSGSDTTPFTTPLPRTPSPTPSRHT